ncbi:DExH-box ATP-dependent RNA helicase DExH6-like [Actinidia eriantha]|uniref:DExH-box ATP-dependent RNA helicase DExH6-like n=1 Tax=Actinidia eriantha TaxID=165200 RepID=UPI00258AD63E|nr:DExH-box ATP-dependent RNA helicase DExH6-like [Actinidia eriantha]
MTPTAPSSSAKKKQKNGKGPKPTDGKGPKVTEAYRIRINEILERFRTSEDDVYTFEADLSNQERRFVHETCRKMGMKSKSSGHGNQRRLSLYKNKKKVDTTKEKENLTSFTFSEEARGVLQNLFTQYPPDDQEGDEIVAKHRRRTENLRYNRDDIFNRPLMCQGEIAKKVGSLASRVEKSPDLRQITEERAKLPIASFRDVITSTVESNQVVLISGETGCGKTTQVPQFLLDDRWGKRESCKIVCTQPRRISATSVAERISCERGENIGESVGYKIRLESKGGRHSSIVFCTNGVLLRVLVSKGTGKLKAVSPKTPPRDDVSDITHIIVDEIHERDRNSDFMLAILRDMLPSYPHLRLVLMSATLDAERFSQYFGGSPIIRVPGFTYPVKVFYLEDVLSILKGAESNHLDCTSEDTTAEQFELTEEYRIALDEAINLAWSNDEFESLLDLVSSEGTPQIFNYQHSLSGMTPLMVFAGKGRVGDVCMLLSFGADCHLRANDGTTALELAERENQEEAADIIRNHMEKVPSNSEEEKELLNKYLSTSNPELVDVVLIEQLLRKICMDSTDGAILVFLPGWDDINKVRERLCTSPFFKNSSKYIISALHSMVPSEEQKKVFRKSPPGCRKIVLSTNIAETAITINDVVYVIDSGRMKEKSYDPYDNVSTLQTSWVSKASAKQREGRAGRCQPGICYHLYSKLRAASLADFQVPEIKRTPIEELCLQAKLLEPNCKIEDFLSKTLDPPVFETIRNATIVLQDIGALSVDGELTDLGEKLGALPVHPLISKMLLFAILLKCLDPALTLACAANYRDPFTLPMLPNEKKRAAAAKSELALLSGGNSDQLAVIAAFECWKNAKNKGQEKQFCSEYFVSSGTMSMLSRMRKQLQNELLRHGFIPEDVSSCNLNAHDPGILRAVLVSGLYPMVARLRPPLRNTRRFVETAGGDKVRLHPHSSNFKLSFMKSSDRPLIVYDEITRGDGGMHIRNCSVTGPLPLLLWATEIVVAPVNDTDDGDDDESDYEDTDEDKIDEDKTEIQNKSGAQSGNKIMSSPDNAVKVVVDRWLSFESTALDVAQIYCLRERLSSAILSKVICPRKILPPFLGASMHAIACVLSYDGLSGVSLQSEPVDALTSIVNATEINQSTPRGTEMMGQDSNRFLKSLMFSHTRRNTPSNLPTNIPPPYVLTMNSNGLTLVNSGGALRGSGIVGPLAPMGDSTKRQRGN